MTDRDKHRVESIIGILSDQAQSPADRCRWAIEAAERALSRGDDESPRKIPAPAENPATRRVSP